MHCCTFFLMYIYLQYIIFDYSCSSFDHPSSKCWPHTGQTVGCPCKKIIHSKWSVFYYASPKWSWWNLLMWQCASLFLQWLSRKTTSHIWPQSQLVHRQGSMSVTLEFGQSSYVPSQLLRQCKASQDGGWANCGCFILCSRKLGFTWIYCRNFRKGRGQDGQVHKRIG